MGTDQVFHTKPLLSLIAFIGVAASAITGNATSELNATTPTESVLASFYTSTNLGYDPTREALLGPDGYLYETMQESGTGNGGTVYMATKSGVAQTIYSFSDSAGDGKIPVAGLVVGPNVRLYGIALNGQANSCQNITGHAGCGALFRMALDGQESIVYSFGASATEVSNLTTSLMLDSDGTCSTSYTGSADGDGTVYSLTSAVVETILHSFDRLRCVESFNAAAQAGRHRQATQNSSNLRCFSEA